MKFIHKKIKFDNVPCQTIFQLLLIGAEFIFFSRSISQAREAIDFVPNLV